MAFTIYSIMGYLYCSFLFKPVLIQVIGRVHSELTLVSKESKDQLKSPTSPDLRIVLG